MPGSRHRGRALVLGALLVLLAGCGGSGSADPSDFTGTRLDPDPFVVSPTPLVGTDGAAYSLTEDTDKDLTLVFFGYTHCPDICGQVMATLAGTLARLDEEQKERLDVVFVTTDPARDDEATVEKYVDAFDPSIVGVTGDLDDNRLAQLSGCQRVRAGRCPANRRSIGLPHVGEGRTRGSPGASAGRQGLADRRRSGDRRSAGGE